MLLTFGGGKCILHKSQSSPPKSALGYKKIFCLTYIKNAWVVFMLFFNAIQQYLDWKYFLERNNQLYG